MRRATGLANTDSTGKSDPYATLTFGGVKRKSKTKTDTLNPEWDETFCFPFKDVEMLRAEGGALLVNLFDYDRIGV